MEKGEIDRFEQFLRLSQCFQKSSSTAEETKRVKLQNYSKAQKIYFHVTSDVFGIHQYTMR